MMVWMMGRCTVISTFSAQIKNNLCQIREIANVLLEITAFLIK
jgi:hypothetical protein